ADAELEVLHWEARFARADLHPSRRLVQEALVRRQEAVLHVWKAGAPPNSQLTVTQSSGDVDWALCVPLHDSACKGWGLYLTGHGGQEQASSALGALEQIELGDDVKFTELV